MQMAMFKFDLSAGLSNADGLVKVKAKFTRQTKADHVGMQDGKLMLWTACTDRGDEETRTFIIRGTGQEIAHPHRSTYMNEYHYIGAVFDGPYVWHVFEIAGR